MRVVTFCKKINITTSTQEEVFHEQMAVLLLDTQGSVMYGNGWKDNGNGTFTSTAKQSSYKEKCGWPAKAG